MLNSLDHAGKRFRRLRAKRPLRDLGGECVRRGSDTALFVSEKITERRRESMPGCGSRRGWLRREAEEAWKLGCGACCSWIPRQKNERATQRMRIADRAADVRALKRDLPDLLVITDVCLCEYMSHGIAGSCGRRRHAHI